MLETKMDENGCIDSLQAYPAFHFLQIVQLLGRLCTRNRF